MDEKLELEIRGLRARTYLKRKAAARDNKRINRILDAILLGLVITLYVTISILI